MIDATRHRPIFSPEAFADQKVDIIGVGATGSRIAMGIAKLGITNIHVWDFDVVESHNVANQIYGNDHIGQPKCEALKEIIKRDTGTEVTAHNEKVTGEQSLGPVVFLLTDSMQSRRQIWNGGIRYKPFIPVMIETRMGTEEGRVYTINPLQSREVKAWEETLTDNMEPNIETAPCGTALTVGQTAEIVSGIAVWQLIRWFSREQGDQAEPVEIDNEIIFSLRPYLFLTRQFV